MPVRDSTGRLRRFVASLPEVEPAIVAPVPVAPVPVAPEPLWMPNPNYGRDEAIRAYLDRFPPRVPVGPVGDAIDPPAAPPPPPPAPYDRDAAVAAYLRRFPPPAVAAPSVPPPPPQPAPAIATPSVPKSPPIDPIDPTVPGAEIFARLPPLNPFRRRRYDAPGPLPGFDSPAVPSSETSSGGMGSFVESKSGNSLNSFDLGSEVRRIREDQYDRAISRLRKQLTTLDDQDDSRTSRARRDVINKQIERLEVSKLASQRDSGTSESKSSEESSGSGLLFRSGPIQRTLDESMQEFRDNQTRLNKSMSEFKTFMDKADEYAPSGLEARLARDEAAGAGAASAAAAGAPPPAQREAFGRERGLQPQLPMSIFAYNLPPNVTGRTRERRESLGIPRRAELSMSELNLRDPTQSEASARSRSDEDLFAQQSTPMRNPDDLQRSPAPLPGWDESNVSVGSNTSTYGSGREIADPKSISDMLDELNE